MLKRRRVIGRPLLVATAGIAAVAYACGSPVSGNLSIGDSGPADASSDTIGSSDVAGNLSVILDGGDAGDASDASDASSDAPSDGG